MMRNFDFSAQMQIMAGFLDSLDARFLIAEWNKPLLTKIAAYLAGNELALEYGMDATKGIAIFGPPGTGKTSLLTYIEESKWLKFASKSSAELAEVYRSNRQDEIKSLLEGYFCKERKVKTARDLFVDDVGSERTVIHYGDKYESFVEIVQARDWLYYKLANRPVIHLTTNLTFKELEARYGWRVSSRIAGLCNIVVIPGDAPDMRKVMNKEITSQAKNLVI